jgi:SAM-dependent methyltransferase
MRARSSLRIRKLLHSIDTAGKGLEIGPLDNPLIDRATHHIKYVDQLDRIGLRTKYSGNPFVDVARIVEPDFVTKNAPLSDTIGERVDYILASHVIEHVPDFIGFLRECSNVLNENGVLSLAVPDKRYSFDIKRRCSTFPDILAAWIERRNAPTIRDLCDHYFEVVRVDPEQLWRGVDVASLEAYHSYEEALEVAFNGRTDARFIDCHIWIFTYASFMSLLATCRARALIDFEPIHSVAPTRNEMEFFCSLKKTKEIL